MAIRWWQLTARGLVFCGALLVAALSTLGGADAMTFALERGRGGTYIAARGEIVDGDAQKFARLVPHATVDSRGLRHMVVGSDGGSVEEAMAMAEVIRANSFFVVVDQECASACAAILYPAGRHFMLLDSGRLGFHQCYDAISLRVAPECTEEIARQAAVHGFPYGTLKVLAEMSGPAVSLNKFGSLGRLPLPHHHRIQTPHERVHQHEFLIDAE